MFAAVYILLQVSRAVRLGDPLSIPLHQLQNGAFLLFTFFMISGPKTTPDSRLGRLVFASLVAFGTTVRAISSVSQYRATMGSGV